MSLTTPDNNPVATIYKWIGDCIAVGGVAATVAGYLPTLAAGASLIWLLISIWESKTISGFISRSRIRRSKYRMRRMLAKQKILSAKILAESHLAAAEIKATQVLAQAVDEAKITKAQDKAIDTFLDDTIGTE